MQSTTTFVLALFAQSARSLPFILSDKAPSQKQTSVTSAVCVFRQKSDSVKFQGALQTGRWRSSSSRSGAMAPLTGAEKAFFRGKRGTRAFRAPVAASMSAYFVADGTTLPELPTTRPGPPDSASTCKTAQSKFALTAKPLMPSVTAIPLPHTPPPHRP